MDPRRLRRGAGDRHVRRQPRRLPRGQLRAEARRPVPARARLLGQLRPARAGTAGASAARPPYFNNPFDSLAHTGGDHLDWLRSRLSLLLVCGPGDVGGHDRRAGQLQAPRRPARRRGSAASWTSGATTSRTTGPPGEHSSPIICHGSADGGTHEDQHLVGLLLGTEEDWPTAFETLVSRLGPIADASGTKHRVTTERITMEPFDLRDKPRYDLVVDRLAYWYYLPREWLKKVALMDDVYLLNSPFTFQSMEKHAAYCAMLRLGLKVPADRPRPAQEPARQRALRLHGGQVQPAVRPRRDRRADRLPAVHEALRRRPVDRRQPHPRQRRAAPRLRRVRASG